MRRREKIPNKLDLEAMQEGIPEEHLPEVKAWKGEYRFTLVNRADRRRMARNQPHGEHIQRVRGGIAKLGER